MAKESEGSGVGSDDGAMVVTVFGGSKNVVGRRGGSSVLEASVEDDGARRCAGR